MQETAAMDTVLNGPLSKFQTVWKIFYNINAMYIKLMSDCLSSDCLP